MTPPLPAAGTERLTLSSGGNEIGSGSEWETKKCRRIREVRPRPRWMHHRLRSVPPLAGPALRRPLWRSARRDLRRSSRRWRGEGRSIRVRAGEEEHRAADHGGTGRAGDRASRGPGPGCSRVRSGRWRFANSVPGWLAWLAAGVFMSGPVFMRVLDADLIGTDVLLLWSGWHRQVRTASPCPLIA